MSMYLRQVCLVAAELRTAIRELTHGFGLKDLSKNLVDALNPDLPADARQQNIDAATKPFYDPRKTIA